MPHLCAARHLPLLILLLCAQLTQALAEECPGMMMRHQLNCDEAMQQAARILKNGRALNTAQITLTLSEIDTLGFAQPHPVATARYTPLAAAAACRRTEVVASLLAAKAQPDARSADGQTALMLAARWNATDALLLLVAARADLNLKNQHAWTALMQAISHDAAEAAQLLLAAGATVQTRDREGYTPLSLARIRSPRLVEPLRRAGAPEGHYPPLEGC